MSIESSLSSRLVASVTIPKTICSVTVLIEEVKHASFCIKLYNKSNEQMDLLGILYLTSVLVNHPSRFGSLQLAIFAKDMRKMNKSGLKSVLHRMIIVLIF